MLGKDGGVIQQAIDRYYCPDTAFSHPLARFESGPDSRETLKNLWAVYKVSQSSAIRVQGRVTVLLQVACWGIRYTINDLYWDKAKSEVIVDLTYDSLGIAPLLFSDVRLVSIFNLRQSQEDGLYRIQSHWDCYPIDGVRRWKVWGVPVNLPYWIYLRVAAVSGNVVGGTLRWLGWF